MKAGCIPYIVTGTGKPLMAFQVSSDARYGGPDPMISKGGIEPGESPRDAALREAAEELGLRESNIVKGTLRKAWKGRSKGYDLEIYTAQVIDRHDFAIPHFETKEVVWMTMDEFKQRGRKDHAIIVRMIYMGNFFA